MDHRFEWEGQGRYDISGCCRFMDMSGPMLYCPLLRIAQENVTNKSELSKKLDNRTIRDWSKIDCSRIDPYALHGYYAEKSK